MFDTSPDNPVCIPIVCQLVANARQASGKTTKDCATALGIPHKRFLQIESGKVIPSLPELEMLAYYFDLQPQEFFNEEEINFPTAHAGFDQMQQLVQLRHRIISASLQLARSQKKLSLKALSTQSGIPSARIKRYELTALPVPLNDLKAICNSLEIELPDLLDQTGFIAEKKKAKKEEDHFDSLSKNLKDFISDPANESYLKLAMRLKETGLENVESLAAGLQQLAESAK